jgi:DNA-binding YbaB/EbfC family protein
MTNLQQLMQMGQQLQTRMTNLQESLGSQKITGTSGGGMVSATVDGKGEVKEVRIDPTCVDKDDVEMLEDLVVAAISQAQTKARQVYDEEMKKAAGGLPMQIPGLL